MMVKTSIMERMKNNYEFRDRHFLTRRIPVIIRLDGRAFHTKTRKCDKPFDSRFMYSMEQAAIRVCEEVQGAKCAYVQSDEISILVTDFDRLTSEAYFDYNIQKMVSITASVASVCFSKPNLFDMTCEFDSRVFNIPKEEVCNYFIARQLDWIRNSIQMLCHANFSHSELHNKNQSDMHEMLHGMGINWAKDCSDKQKSGIYIEKVKKENGVCSWEILLKCPIFKDERDVVEKYLVPKEV